MVASSCPWSSTTPAISATVTCARNWHDEDCDSRPGALPADMSTRPYRNSLSWTRLRSPPGVSPVAPATGVVGLTCRSAVCAGVLGQSSQLQGGLSDTNSLPPPVQVVFSECEVPAVAGTAPTGACVMSSTSTTRTTSPMRFANLKAGTYYDVWCGAYEPPAADMTGSQCGTVTATEFSHWSFSPITTQATGGFVAAGQPNIPTGTLSQSGQPRIAVDATGVTASLVSSRNEDIICAVIPLSQLASGDPGVSSLLSCNPTGPSTCVTSPSMWPCSCPASNPLTNVMINSDPTSVCSTAQGWARDYRIAFTPPDNSAATDYSVYCATQTTRVVSTAARFTSAGFYPFGNCQSTMSISTSGAVTFSTDVAINPNSEVSCIVQSTLCAAPTAVQVTRVNGPFDGCGQQAVASQKKTMMANVRATFTFSGAIAQGTCYNVYCVMEAAGIVSQAGGPCCTPGFSPGGRVTVAPRGATSALVNATLTSGPCDTVVCTAQLATAPEPTGDQVLAGLDGSGAAAAARYITTGVQRNTPIVGSFVNLVASSQYAAYCAASNCAGGAIVFRSVRVTFTTGAAGQADPDCSFTVNSTRCSGHGMCYVEVEVSQRCVCNSGYTGLVCDQVMIACPVPDPCNAGHCVAPAAGIVAPYTCACPGTIQSPWNHCSGGALVPSTLTPLFYTRSATSSKALWALFGVFAVPAVAIALVVIAALSYAAAKKILLPTTFAPPTFMPAGPPPLPPLFPPASPL